MGMAKAIHQLIYGSAILIMDFVMTNANATIMAFTFPIDLNSNILAMLEMVMERKFGGKKPKAC